MDHERVATENLQGTPPEVTVFVNEKPVELIGDQHTGAEIKRAAIDADIQIDLDFVLLLERSPERTMVVHDRRRIKISRGDRFQAIAPDDNS